MKNLVNSIVLLNQDNKALDAQPIPTKEAILLIKEYWDQEGKGEKKTRAVWFSTSDLLMILSLITNQGGDGARIFFGKYPDKDVDLPIPEYVNMNTLVFVPTKKNEAGGHSDIFNIEELVQHPEQATSTGTAANHGELCPQKCN